MTALFLSLTWIMDQTFLEQFRQQLATWIETRLSEHRLPFQRLDLCPRVITEQGRLVPDIVLWINRDSQLAGSVILLPEVVDDRTCREGAALASALGLGHFTLWAAHEVTIWDASNSPALLKTLPLSSSKLISPSDFHQTLDELLDYLKNIVVTSAPATADFSAHYFANLCLRNLQDLAPGLSESVRVTAGQTAADLWVEHAPLEKAWLSLWRLLYLLRHHRLPPGLQPERLESTIRYALDDLTQGQPSWLEIQESEPPLPESAAIRLHHLSSRLKQLGWPRDEDQAQKLFELLLSEAANRFKLTTPALPWDVTSAQLWVNCRPPEQTFPCSLVAPRPFLAGWSFNTERHTQSDNSHHAETLQALPQGTTYNKAVALLDDKRLPPRADRDYRLMNLRQVWPTRRFDLPRDTPAWLWDALHLIGASMDDLSLLLPRGWHCAPGIDILWPQLTQRYRLTEVATVNPSHQALRLTATAGENSHILLHRNEEAMEVPTTILPQQFPDLIHLWLQADSEVLQLLHDRRLTCINTDEPEHDEKLAWGIFLFYNTSLGKYLRHFCGEQGNQHDANKVASWVVTKGLPLPNEMIIADLSLLGSREDGVVPSTEVLDREFNSIFGPVPVLPQELDQAEAGAPTARRKSRGSAAQIAATVFVDGIPLFPEHYLMNHYRPTLCSYELCGPLLIIENFFDRVLLQADGQKFVLEVSGEVIADALILASYTEATQVSLPQDDSITESLTRSYRTDLNRLWDNLTRECRRAEPRRQVAINLARKIWRQRGLPPEDVFKLQAK